MLGEAAKLLRLTPDALKYVVKPKVDAAVDTLLLNVTILNPLACGVAVPRNGTLLNRPKSPLHGDVLNNQVEIHDHPIFGVDGSPETPVATYIHIDQESRVTEPYDERAHGPLILWSKPDELNARHNHDGENCKMGNTRS